MCDDGEEEDGLSRSAARLEEGRSDQEVRTERWKKRRLLLQVLRHTHRSVTRQSGPTVNRCSISACVGTALDSDCHRQV